MDIKLTQSYYQSVGRQTLLDTMKSSLPTAGRNDASDTQRDDYKPCGILPRIGTGISTFGTGKGMTAKRKL